MKRRACLPVCLALTVSAWAGGLRAQAARADLRRLGPDERIVIDGRLDEPAWGKATRLSPLTQVEPVEGARPTKPTLVRLCYDRDHFYLSLICYDDPAVVRGRMLQRDARLDPDDRVEFWLDTFHDRRFAYWFQIGPGGSKGDALVSQNGFNKSWDGIWEGRAMQTGEGWQAEVAIPFKTLSFAEGGRTWGFNLRRLRKENEEEDRWARPLVAYSFFRLNEAGTLAGFEGIRQGVGLDVVPYFKSTARTDRSAADEDVSVLGDAGIDLSYRISPSLNLRLTFNTDFAETEVDERQSNLTRFPLFFPEKRDFFLEDAGLFDFGVRGEFGARGTDVIPFFSRRIGRDDDGAEIPILVGGKLSGRVDDWNIGVLQVVQDDHRTAGGVEVDRRALGVARISRNIGREGSVGFIGTVGDPTESGAATTAGADFRLGDSRAFGPGAGYTVRGWFLDTQSGGVGGDGNAYGLQVDYNSRAWVVSLSEAHVEAGFSPELGFVRRTGIRTHGLDARYTWRSDDDGWLRRYEAKVSPTVTTTEDGDKDTWVVPLGPGRFTLRSDDWVEYEVHRIYERLRQDFLIHTGVVVPAGDYAQTQHIVALRTSESRWLNVSGRLRFGDFYTGNLTSFDVDPTLILGPHLSIGGGYEENRVRLDAGRFTTRILSGRIDISFSPDVTWQNLGQYDSDSKNLSVQSRFRWIHRPGQELFLVGLLGWEKAAHSAPLVPATQEVALKVQYTIRF